MVWCLILVAIVIFDTHTSIICLNPSSGIITIQHRILKSQKYLTNKHKSMWKVLYGYMFVFNPLARI